MSYCIECQLFWYSGTKVGQTFEESNFHFNKHLFAAATEQKNGKNGAF